MCIADSRAREPKITVARVPSRAVIATIGLLLLSHARRSGLHPVDGARRPLGPSTSTGCPGGYTTDDSVLLSCPPIFSGAWPRLPSSLLLRQPTLEDVVHLSDLRLQILALARVWITDVVQVQGGSPIFPKPPRQH